MPRTRKKRLLIVDDEREILSILKELLARPGRELDTALDRATAERLARDKYYDLVISDVFLPDSRQLELVDFLKEIDLDYRVILMSGYLDLRDALPGGDEEYTVNFLTYLADRKGVLCIFKKPLDLPRLERTVDIILEDDHEPPQRK